MQNDKLITNFISKLKAYTFFCVVVCIGSIVIWALKAEISSSLVVIGNLQLETPPIIVKSPAKSTVSQIHIINTQHVLRGEALITLNSGKEHSQLLNLTNEYNHWLALHKEVSPEIDVKATEPFPPQTLVSNSIPIDVSDLAKKIRKNNNSLSEMSKIKLRIIQKMTFLTTAINDINEVIISKVIKAPLDGVIYDLATATDLEQVIYGQELFKIIPIKNKLILKLNVKAQDRGKLSLGQESRVVFSTISSRDTPTLTAKIDEISPLARLDNLVGEYYYPVELELSDIEGFEQEWQVKLVQGMKAEVYLNISKTTPSSYLLKSIQQSLAKAWSE
jgi:multidrug efflux pump subunit AcrA (membrane-fusion protein)